MGKLLWFWPLGKAWEPALELTKDSSTDLLQSLKTAVSSRAETQSEVSPPSWILRGIWGWLYELSEHINLDVCGAAQVAMSVPQLRRCMEEKVVNPSKSSPWLKFINNWNFTSFDICVLLPVAHIAISFYKDQEIADKRWNTLSSFSKPGTNEKVHVREMKQES